jgi:hypothetical protein
MSEPQRLSKILPGVMLEIQRRMRRYSETHPEGRGMSTERETAEERTGALQGVYGQGKQRMTDGY